MQVTIVCLGDYDSLADTLYTIVERRAKVDFIIQWRRITVYGCQVFYSGLQRGHVIWCMCERGEGGIGLGGDKGSRTLLEHGIM